MSDAVGESVIEGKINLFRIAMSILALTIVITASGFVILHTHLLMYTEMSVINIPLQLYVTSGLSLTIIMSLIVGCLWISWVYAQMVIAAGKLLADRGYPNRARFTVGLAFALLVAVYIYMLLSLGNFYISIAIFVVVFSLLAAIYNSTIPDDGRTEGQRFASYFKLPSHIFTHSYRSVISTISFSFLIAAYLVLISFMYGALSYKTVPMMVGGGKPTTVTLVFRDGTDVTRIGLPMANDHQTESICLLMPLTDGLLVYVPSSDLVATIPDEVILSVRDLSKSMDCKPMSPWRPR